MSKLSFARAASEPPQPITSGILNSKSIILPVQEETENRNEGEDGVQDEKALSELLKIGHP